MWEHGGCLESVQQDAILRCDQMCEVGMGGQPTDITFIYLLSACSRAGLVDEGTCCYASMVTGYMISTKLECYTCIVDFLAMLSMGDRKYGHSNAL